MGGPPASDAENIADLRRRMEHAEDSLNGLEEIMARKVLTDIQRLQRDSHPPQPVVMRTEFQLLDEDLRRSINRIYAYMAFVVSFQTAILAGLVTWWIVS